MQDKERNSIILLQTDDINYQIIILFACAFLDGEKTLVFTTSTEQLIDKALRNHHKEGVVFGELHQADIAHTIDSALSPSRYSHYEDAILLFIGISQSQLEEGFIYLEKHYNIIKG